MSDIWAALREPFPPDQIGKLPATAKRPELDYVGHAAVTNRLLTVVPEDWTYDITPVVVYGSVETFQDGRRFVPDVDGVPHVVAVFGSMTINGVTRQEVGEVDAYTTYGDEMKKAISDFIRRAAMRFGVALDLWSKEDLSASTADAETPAAAAKGDKGKVSRSAAAGTTSGSERETSGRGDLAAPDVTGQEAGPETSDPPNGSQVSPASPCLHLSGVYLDREASRERKAPVHRCNDCHDEVAA